MTATGWPAPTVAHVHGTVTVPGSKSETNRALILAALAEGHSTIVGGLRARDTDLMAAALTALGAQIEHRRELAHEGGGARDVDHWAVTPLPGSTGDPGATEPTSTPTVSPVRIDVGLAGTVMRFVPPVAALTGARVTFDGDPRSRERPMAPLLDALRVIGAHVDGDRLPFTIRGTGGLFGGEVAVDTHQSSQFLSALLLIGARTVRGLRCTTGDRRVSAAHIAMTLEMLAAAGVTVTQPDERSWQVAAGPIAARTWRIAPDLSNAAAYLAAAVAVGGEVSVPGWPQRTEQAGAAFLGLAEQMGARVEQDGDLITVRGDGAPHGLDADLGDVGELTPTVAALASIADGPSRLTGIGHLRGHETDRLAALADNLADLGGRITVERDGLLIEPRPLRGGLWRCHGDHRMATAGALIGLRVPGIILDDVSCTSKTLPDFAARWQELTSSPIGDVGTAIGTRVPPSAT